jgi:hypothetical protein
MTLCLLSRRKTELCGLIYPFNRHTASSECGLTEFESS